MLLTRNAIEFALKKSGIKRTDTAVEKLFSKFLSLRTFKDVLPALNDLDELNTRVAILSNGDSIHARQADLKKPVCRFFRRT